MGAGEGIIFVIYRARLDGCDGDRRGGRGGGVAPIVKEGRTKGEVSIRMREVAEEGSVDELTSFEKVVVFRT